MSIVMSGQVYVGSAIALRLLKGGDYRTIENHRTNICRKLGIEAANALLRFAVQHKAELR
jgi:DNA-binding CsgD family transcriptional regulator